MAKATKINFNDENISPKAVARRLLSGKLEGLAMWREDWDEEGEALSDEQAAAIDAEVQNLITSVRNRFGARYDAGRKLQKTRKQSPSN